MEIQLSLERFVSRLDIRQREHKSYIFDPIRKKEIILQPEEWVRQLFISYLIEEKKIGPKLIAIEKSLELHGLKKRSDIVVYNQKGIPCMIIECKSHKEPLNQRVFDQASRYNIALKLPYLVITNGISCMLVRVDFDSGEYFFLDEIPGLEILNQIN